MNALLHKLFKSGVPTGAAERMRWNIADDGALDQIFRSARSHNGFLDRAVPDTLIEEAWNLARMGPTSVNCSPLRIVVVRTAADKARLEVALVPGNVEKTRSAPVTIIFGHDLDFHEHLPRLFPHADVRSWFVGPDKSRFVESTAFRNGTLQAAYFMLAARAVGLDIGPMSGFDNAAVDAAFFAGTGIRSNFLCNIGYGDDSKLFARSPRFDLDEIAQGA